ncbi:hypothetical protein ABZ553_08015 [Streptomyces sparsogenes]|uniref:hypothetical protein n=1 Tax=Streptomyces sparsogenes TaxID=67365 RepID=UPI0033FB301C
MTDNPIFAVAAKAEALRADGVDVITLAAGEPQAASSAVVVEAAVNAVRDPATHHYGTAQGDPALRALVGYAAGGGDDLGVPGPAGRGDQDLVAGVSTRPDASGCASPSTTTR